MSDKPEEIPQFENEDEEREFWATHDSTEYVDWSKAQKNSTFSRLRPSTREESARYNPHSEI